MENALHISMPVWIMLSVLSVTIAVFQGWNTALDKADGDISVTYKSTFIKSFISTDHS